VAIGRNEEKGVGDCLKSVLNQTIKPKKVIFVNDNSTDRTKEIASSFKDVEVMDFPEKHPSWVDSPNLARVVNLGIYKIGMIKSINYILTMGGDTILPPDYVEYILSKMIKHPELVVASGTIDDEYTFIPRGTARITKMDYWKKIGLGYRVHPGFEAYHVYKAGTMNLAHRVFKINATSSKKTGERYSPKHWYNEGKGSKALGYVLPYVLVKAILLSRKSPKCSYNFVKGYLQNKTELFEDDLRKNVSKNQYNLIRFQQKKIISRLLKRSSD